MNRSPDLSLYGYSMVDDPSSNLYTFSKRLVFRMSKWTGLFRLASLKTRQSLRVLCYHGFSIDDESLFRPRLFMQLSTFRRRLEYLEKHSFPVLSLDAALSRLKEGTLPARATVITVDDGFYSFYRHAVPLLREFSFPATVYIASGDFLRGLPIFRLVVQYMFWKTRAKMLRLDGLTNTGAGQIALSSPETSRNVMWEIVQFGDSLGTDAQRTELASEVGIRLRIDYQEIVGKRTFCLMNTDELSNLASSQIDVQLHTHNHRLPENPALAEEEIRQNRRVLAPIVKKPLMHFCYPSGFWTRQHWPTLAVSGIQSAMTCEPGLNDSHTPNFAMNRFLDGEDILQIEFEAEMSGYAEQLRRASFRRWRAPLPG
jgi:peptidoglycan/xylan/chitin deacetylase (PgdA/CDA1 family)